MKYEHYEDQTKLTASTESDGGTLTAKMISGLYQSLQAQWTKSVYASYGIDWATAEPQGPPPIPELPVEHSTEPVIGYRTWRVSREGRLHDWTISFQISCIPYGDIEPEPEPEPEPEKPYRLWSPVQGTEWAGPILRADGKPCAYDPHSHHWRDREDHCHGIYAHAIPEWTDFGPDRAIGKLEATGRVVVHERGFRAEAVRITHLVLSPTLIGTDAKKDLERIYGCDITYNPEDLL